MLLDVNGLVSNLLVNLDNVESNGLGQRSALADGDDIAFTEEESRGAVCCDILVTLFVPDEEHVKMITNGRGAW